MEEFSKKVEQITKKLQGVLNPLIQYVNKHKVIASVGTGVIACAMVICIVMASIQNNKIVVESSETSGVEIVNLDEEEAITRTLSDVPTLTLEENAYEEVNLFVSNYYKALQEGDVEVVATMVDRLEETEAITIEKRSGYIDSYSNITCYTKLGPIDNTYIVYAYYEVHFTDIQTPTPGLSSIYLYTEEDGSFKIALGEMEADLATYLQEASAQDDVVDLFNTVQVKYNESIAADQALSDFLVEFPTRLKTEISEELAAIAVVENAEVAAAEAEAAEATQDQTVTTQTITTYEVKANTTVNIRASDSLTADKKGKATEGDLFTCTEQRANGWSQIIFEGDTAYIKTEYLDIIETMEEEVPIQEETVEEESEETTSTDGVSSGTAKVITTVNIRAGASETASKLGVAYPGDQFKVIMKQADGWTKIEYEGDNAYVKSEFVEQ